MLAAIVVVVAIAAPDSAWAKKKDKTKAATETEEEFGDAAVGRKFHKQIIEALGEYDHNGLAAYVAKVGTEVAAHAEGEEYQWHFTVLDTEMVNAFALPGGYVYITRALLAHLNSEAQLAAVLGHEIGHVTARHAARQQTAALVVGKVAGSIARESASGPGGFNLGNLFGAGLVRGYGREMEIEADELGTKMISAAGYDASASLEVIEMLKAREQYEANSTEEAAAAGAYHAMLASHPDKDRRLKELVEQSLRSAPATRGAGRDEYLQHIDGMAWAGSAGQGVIRGPRFLHAQLNFAVTFPDNWEIKNLPDRLVGLPQSGEAMMHITLAQRDKKERKRASIDEFLQKKMGLRRWQNGRVTEINGLEAFITTVPKAPSLYGPRLARVAVIFHGDNAYIFNGATQDEDRQRAFNREFDAIIGSMRPLAEDEKRLAQPKAVRIVEMPHDARLADFGDIENVADPEALLRLLNGVYPEGEPDPGARIKTIR